MSAEQPAGPLSAELARQERITRAIDGLAAGWMQAYDETAAERDRYRTAWRNARGRAWLATHPDAAAPPPEAQNGGAAAAHATGWEGTSVTPQQPAGPNVDTAAVRRAHSDQRDCSRAIRALCDAIEARDAELAELRVTLANERADYAGLQGEREDAEQQRAARDAEIRELRAMVERLRRAGS